MNNLALAILTTVAISTAMHAKEPKLTLGELNKCAFEDPGAEPIWRFYVELCGQQSAPNHNDQEFQALEKLPPKLRDVCLLLRYQLLWGNGGTEDSALMEDKASSEKLLKMTAEAYLRFGDKERAKMMSEISSLLEKHEKTLEEAVRTDRLKGYTSPIERYDKLWEDIEFDYIAEIIEDMKADSHAYTYPR